MSAIDVPQQNQHTEDDVNRQAEDGSNQQAIVMMENVETPSTSGHYCRKTSQ